MNAQERTKEELLASLREVLKEALEFNRQDARANAQAGYTEELVTVCNGGSSPHNLRLHAE